MTLEAWCERERLGLAPTEGEWAVVALPDDEMPLQASEGDD